jgi:hypothetical protein
MSLGTIGNTASRGIVLDSIRKPVQAFINYFATSAPIYSGSLVTSGISSGTFDLYRLVGRISTGNSALYAVHIKNLTMNTNTTSGAISLGPNYVPLTGVVYTIVLFTPFFICAPTSILRVTHLISPTPTIEPNMGKTKHLLTIANTI